MPILSVVINVTDVARSVDFYTRFLGARVVESNGDRAALDVVTASLQLRRVVAGEVSTFVADDLQLGFRHVGFKVADLGDRVARLRAAGIPFHLEPIHAEGDVWIAFFADPDGTLVELVEGPLRYHETYDDAAVAADWALGEPDRPRFDHIGETVADLAVTRAYFEQLGYSHMAGIHQPNDSRGFEIDFLRDGDTSLEIFTFSGAPTKRRAPQLDAPGFAAVEFEGTIPTGAEHLGAVDGVSRHADPDGLVHFVAAV
jgi:catechol 2,3-dioxygenase-like lactoylglutathione lyase family enzyme